jgi:hypothetical protein
MKFGIFGTGIVGRTLAARLAQLGHEAMIGTRNVADTLARTQPDRMGNPPFGEWHRQNAAVRLGSFAEAAAFGEMLVNATSGTGAPEALQAAGEANLAGKVLIDIANPLDYSTGMPPSLFVKDTDSLGEQLQRAFPDLRVVKTLNTMNAHVMVYPASVADGDHTVFVSGNDAGAKAAVADLLRSFGWKDILDLGDITTARGVEMILPVWLRLRTVLQTSRFNFKIMK